jgi:hypothetical protein
MAGHSFGPARPNRSIFTLRVPIPLEPERGRPRSPSQTFVTLGTNLSVSSTYPGFNVINMTCADVTQRTERYRAPTGAFEPTIPSGTTLLSSHLNLETNVGKVRTEVLKVGGCNRTPKRRYGWEVCARLILEEHVVRRKVEV